MTFLIGILILLLEPNGLFHVESTPVSVEISQTSIDISSSQEIPISAEPLEQIKKDLTSITEIRHGDPTQALIALTFDDGFEPEDSLRMLDILREKTVKATFFLKGNWIEEHKDITQRIIDDGHEMGNHSYDHPDFAKISIKKARQAILKQEEILIKQHSYSPKPYFRFPYGSRTPAMLQLIKEHGYISVMWDIDTLDWLKDPEYIESEALNNAHNGAIILMHLGKKTTAQVLPRIIDGLREKGFTLVTVSQLINADPNVP